MEELVAFCKKIGPKLLPADLRELNSQESVIALLKGYGCPQVRLDAITINTWDIVANVLIDSCL